ncbi:MAG: GGDEF domain-containing protein, partial [Sphaerochaetaceae bacterium]|nr:GGDEF domain-containing protein [Sphaerochaetaceae bacterium]
LIFETTANSKDYLTGLYNRERAEDQIDRYISKKQSFSVIMIDLDNFKQINDTYGHRFGDEVLAEISYIIKTVFFKSLVSRYGGDEILIVSNLKTESILIKKRFEIEELIKHSRLNEIDNFKISYGFSICDKPNNCSPESIIIEADNNMYRDKS